MAITLTDHGHLVGLGPDERVWDAAARATHDLAWDPAAPLLAVVGGSILVDGSGTARAHADGADLDLSSTGHLLAAHLDGVVDVHEPSGTIVQTAPAARVLWRPGTDELLVADRERARRIGAAGETELLADEGRGELLIAVSPGGELLAVHGQTGPIELVDEEGQQLASFPAHGRLNLAAAIGTTLLATSGADGNVMLYDIVRRGLHLALTLDALGRAPRVRPDGAVRGRDNSERRDPRHRVPDRRADRDRPPPPRGGGGTRQPHAWRAAGTERCGSRTTRDVVRVPPALLGRHVESRSEPAFHDTASPRSRALLDTWLGVRLCPGAPVVEAFEDVLRAGNRIVFGRVDLHGDVGDQFGTGSERGDRAVEAIGPIVFSCQRD